MRSCFTFEHGVSQVQGIPVRCFSNQPACTGHNHGKNSYAKNQQQESNHLPKMLNDIPGGMGKSIWIRIIFAKVDNNKVLVVSMAATVNRQHKKLPPIEKYLTLRTTAFIDQ